MKFFVWKIFFSACILISISGANLYAHLDLKNQKKFYFDQADLEICENAIYINLGNTLIETNVIRTDQAGCYVLENDISD